jgi:putative pyruvate formate lyase activating enzyme
VDDNGVAVRGLLIRHLVLPNRIAGSEEVLSFIAKDISVESYVNIMDQYHPCFKAFDLAELNRRITSEEYRTVVRLATSYGLHRGFGYSHS